MRQSDFNQYIESSIIKNHELAEFEGHLGDIRMSVVCKPPIDDKYIGEIALPGQLHIQAVIGNDSRLRTVYHGMFPIARYIETFSDDDVTKLKNMIVNYYNERILQ